MNVEQSTSSGERQSVSPGVPRPARVVVGVDGSEPSSKALAFAAEEARLRDAVLEVVHAWSLPSLSYVGYLPPEALEDTSAEAASQLEAQVTKVLGEHHTVALELVVSRGPAAQAILEAAEGAELIVVGSRGRGGFAGLLLGSVGSQVVHHAHCPVTVVRS